MNKIFYLLFFCNLITYGQTKECILLKELIDSEKISIFFKLKNDSIVIIDRPKALLECKKDFKESIISYDQTYMEITPDNRGVIMSNKNILILYKTEDFKNKINFYFWQPYSGGTLKVCAKIRSQNKKVRKISYEEGSF